MDESRIPHAVSKYQPPGNSKHRAPIKENSEFTKVQNITVLLFFQTLDFSIENDYHLALLYKILNIKLKSFYRKISQTFQR